MHGRAGARGPRDLRPLPGAGPARRREPDWSCPFILAALVAAAGAASLLTPAGDALRDADRAPSTSPTRAVASTSAPCRAPAALRSSSRSSASAIAALLVNDRLGLISIRGRRGSMSPGADRHCSAAPRSRPRSASSTTAGRSGPAGSSSFSSSWPRWPSALGVTITVGQQPARLPRRSVLGRRRSGSAGFIAAGITARLDRRDDQQHQLHRRARRPVHGCRAHRRGDARASSRSRAEWLVPADGGAPVRGPRRGARRLPALELPSRPKVFIGTTGVFMAVGYALAVLSILGNAKIAVALLVLGVPDHRHVLDHHAPARRGKLAVHARPWPHPPPAPRPGPHAPRRRAAHLRDLHDPRDRQPPPDRVRSALRVHGHRRRLRAACCTC